MFIAIRFGADEEELFNPDCAIRVLFDSIRRKCNCMDKDAISFIDDKGNLIVIQDDKSMDNASKHFIHRGVYTLLAVDKKSDVTSYIPLVDDPSKELLTKLESLSVGSAKKSYVRRNSTKTPQSKPTSQPSGKGRKK